MSEYLPGTAMVVVDAEFEHMLISALRYALGRQTYITSMTAMYISKHLRNLSDNTLRVMRNDLQYYEKRRGQGLIYDDEDCDHIHWFNLRSEIIKEMEKRNVSD